MENNKLADEKYMRLALTLAEKSLLEGEVPVGAIIVFENRVIATGRNRREIGKNALYHAEVDAINNACKILGGWRLFNCTLYVTLEPCVMCSGAIINSRIKRVVVGALDKKAGAFKSAINLFSYNLNHKPIIQYGILENECSEILSRFFDKLRIEKSTQPKLSKQDFLNKKQRPLILTIQKFDQILSFSLFSKEIVKMSDKCNVLITIDNYQFYANSTPDSIYNANSLIAKSTFNHDLSLIDYENDSFTAEYDNKKLTITII